MKERPILFSGPMVRAIQAGTKTQTRRECKDILWDNEACGSNPSAPYVHGKWATPKPCPYGQPGDRLWVRETFGDRADYAAIGAAMRDRYYYAADGKKHGWRYRPSIHMPRAASRLTLEIESVRVERLQDISEEDAQAEGIEQWISERPFLPQAKGLLSENYHSLQFQELWESINGPVSWAANPCVWVVGFKRLEARA